MTALKEYSLSPEAIKGLAVSDANPEHDWRAEAKTWREKARQVEQLVKLGSFEVDLDTGALGWWDGTYAIFGLPPGSPITVEQALSFYDAQAQAEIAKRLDAARVSGEPYTLTVQFRSSTGEIGWAQMSGHVNAIGGSSRLVGVVRDITHERDTEERLRLQANQDVLTGLPNRRAFQVHFDEAIASKSPGEAMALCIVDIDRFKLVNDDHGHATGDRLLQEIGRRLSTTVRSSDFVARLGGDEFAVVLHHIHDKAELHLRASALVAAARAPLTLDHEDLVPTISVGACFIGGQALTAETILKQADIALYKAKMNGRNQYCLFRPSFRKDVIDHGRLLDEVSVGLTRNQFEVHYQPIVDLCTHIVRGWEALVRWNHPTKGFLLPGQFLPALTDPKTSVAIDEFVLTASLRQMRQWLDGGVPVTCAGVNVSETLLKRPDLFSKITSLLEEHALTPDRLKIEVLETAFVGRETHVVASTIEHLAKFGVVSALDDFGTGFASLTHLKQFKVERIKIDRSFIANIHSSGYDHAIV